MYINWQKLEPVSLSSESPLAYIKIENGKLESGNTNGRINGAVNSIEYK